MAWSVGDRVNCKSYFISFEIRLFLFIYLFLNNNKYILSIRLQGKGKITTYWLIGEKPSATIAALTSISDSTVLNTTVPMATQPNNVMANNIKHVTTTITTPAVNSKSLNNNISNHNITSLTPLLQEDNG